MTIDRLQEALSAIGPPLDARELSEMLWLACHITPSEEQPSPVPSTPVVPDSPEVPQPPPPTTPATPPPPAPEPRTGLHPPPAPGAEPVGEASEVLVPTAPMLADALGLQRALRPLKRRIPSRHRRELDEEATAARIADTGRWTPVLVPSPERWLTLNLVVDTGPTMRLWRPLARELTEMLIRQGAFQDVHITYLDETGRITSTPGAPHQDPRTLLDASGRQAVLVLSDCSGPHWWKGHATNAVRLWAQAGPTAILQPLAERLWRRTAAPTTPGLALLPRPAAPNTDLRFTPFDGMVTHGVPVPVLEVAPRWFGAWARLLSGSDPQPTALTTLGPRPSASVPVHRERELPITERVRRFLSTASPDAAELAAHVAVSAPSLPVMRLIQHRILGGSGPGQLAEVLLSGLLRPAGDVRYEFVPGAREALLDTLPRPEALHTHRVLEAVSAEIERRAGTTTETFRALLPTDGGPVRLTAETDHFALITPQTRTHLTPVPTPTTGPDLLQLLGGPDELLGEWPDSPRETVIGEDGPGPVMLDVLRSNPALPHGLIIGPRSPRNALLRTTIFSLALTHSPRIVNFVFADVSGGAAFTGLDALPHGAAAVHTTSADSIRISMLAPALEDERIRRSTALQNAGVSTWEAYQSLTRENSRQEPLPALVVVIEDTDRLVGARPDLVDAFAWFCDTGAPLGMRFIFCTSEDSPLPESLSGHVGWNMGSLDDDHAFLHIFADRAHPVFQPARISRNTGDAIVERMRRYGVHAKALPWPSETAPPTQAAATTPSAVPRFDVLHLNGGGPSGMFEETWALPASTPRNPAIGYDAEGNVLSLYPLDFSSGLPHGLIVGTPESRQRIVRAITLALAAGHSPTNLNFAFAGLGEHPLGDPLDLPHVRYSEDELLGRPQHLQQFLDYLTNELDTRSAAPPHSPPGASAFGANQGDISALYEQYREDPNSVGEARRDFFADYRPDEQASPAPPASAPEVPPRLLITADVSLTFPSSRPELGEALLALAQRGRALGIQLILTSTTIENTTIWDRFLPLLGWRIAASPLPPAELQRVLGRASLDFPDGRTAYLLAGGGSPRRFTMAPEPPSPVIDDFVLRMPDRRPTEILVPDRWTTLADDIENEAVRAAIFEILESESRAWQTEQSANPLHLLFAGAPAEQTMLAAARFYSRALTDLGILTDSEVIDAPWEKLTARTFSETRHKITRCFADARGKVLLLRGERRQSRHYSVPDVALRDLLAAAMEQHRNDVVVMLSGERLMLGQRSPQREAAFVRHFRRTIVIDSDADNQPDRTAQDHSTSGQMSLFSPEEAESFTQSARDGKRSSPDGEPPPRRQVVCPLCLSVLDWSDHQETPFVRLTDEGADILTRDADESDARWRHRTMGTVRACRGSDEVHYLPADYGKFEPLIIALVGAEGSGKTLLLTAMVEQLEQHKAMLAPALRLDPLDANLRWNFWRTNVHPFLEQRRIPPDPPHGQLALTYGLRITSTFSNKSHAVVFIDVASEYWARASVDKTRFLGVADAVIFVADGSVLSGDPDRYSSSLPDTGFTYPLQHLATVRSDQALPPTALVVAKSDVLSQDHEEVARWMSRQDDQALTDLCNVREESMDAYQFLARHDAEPWLAPFRGAEKATIHFASAAGVSPGASEGEAGFPTEGFGPRRVLRPLLSIFAMTGVLPASLIQEPGQP